MRLKKAVSPLIATVLLVMIVVTIGSLMATWIKSYVDQNMAYAEEKTTGPFKCINEVFFDISIIPVGTMFLSDSCDGIIFFRGKNRCGKINTALLWRLLDLTR